MEEIISRLREEMKKGTRNNGRDGDHHGTREEMKEIVVIEMDPIL